MFALRIRPSPAPLVLAQELADIIHEARCGPVLWRGSEQVEWSDDHREWDIATAKAMGLLGVGVEGRDQSCCWKENPHHAIPQVTDRPRVARHWFDEAEAFATGQGSAAGAEDADHVLSQGGGLSADRDHRPGVAQLPAQEERLDSRHMTAFEKAAALERDRQWEQMQPSDLVPQWSRERLADAYFMACYDRRGLLNELGWRALGDESKEEGA